MSSAEFYRLVSAAIRRKVESSNYGVAGRMVITDVARELSDSFASSNNKFDAVRFMGDCGLP